jgi:predicted nucleic acid-binding protein
VEVAAGLRRAHLRGRLSDSRLVAALDDYIDLPLTRHGHRALLTHMLALWANFSAYDATYVALAEHLAGDVLTADERLRRAISSHTPVRVLP